MTDASEYQISMAGGDGEYEKELQRIGAKYAHMYVPRKAYSTPLKEFKVVEDVPAGGDGERAPDRIPGVLALLGELWMENPNLRLGQIIGNASITYYTEDAKAAIALTQWRDYCRDRKAVGGPVSPRMPDCEPDVDAAQLTQAIQTRRRLKCIAQGSHQAQPPDAPPTTCPRCGL